MRCLTNTVRWEDERPDKHSPVGNYWGGRGEMSDKRSRWRSETSDKQLDGEVRRLTNRVRCGGETSDNHSRMGRRDV